jgi:hypothetical protein
MKIEDLVTVVYGRESRHVPKDIDGGRRVAGDEPRPFARAPASTSLRPGTEMPEAGMRDPISPNSRRLGGGVEMPEAGMRDPISPNSRRLGGGVEMPEAGMRDPIFAIRDGKGEGVSVRGRAGDSKNPLPFVK